MEKRDLLTCSSIRPLDGLACLLAFLLGQLARSKRTKAEKLTDQRPTRRRRSTYLRSERETSQTPVAKGEEKRVRYALSYSFADASNDPAKKESRPRLTAMLAR